MQDLNLSEKYRPVCFADIKGQDEAISEIRFFMKNFPTQRAKKAIILNGPSGSGKTCLAYALANEANLEIIELNASDLRNKNQLRLILKPASQQKSLFSRGKIILVDEVDGISARDRGGITELISVIQKTKFPLIITSNNIWKQKFSSLRRKCKIIQLKQLKYKITEKILQEIAQKENLNLGKEILTSIAVKTKGDARAAINDLQTIYYEKIVFPESISERNKEEDIFNALRLIFREDSKIKNLLRVYDSVDMPINDIFLWLEENIPLEYGGEELTIAIDKLSKADIFRGRIRRQQHWRFLVYENILLSVGISSAKSLKGYKKLSLTKYQKPSRILKIWIMNQKNSIKKSIAGKYAEAAHLSRKKALKNFAEIKLILKNPKIQEELKLNEVEAAFLSG